MAVADTKKRATKNLVGVIDEQPSGGEGDRPVKVKMYVWDGKKWVPVGVNFWTPAAKRCITSITTSVPVMVTVTATITRSKYHLVHYLHHNHFLCTMS